jgi:hypothetical protein
MSLRRKRPEQSLHLRSHGSRGPASLSRQLAVAGSTFEMSFQAAAT